MLRSVVLNLTRFKNADGTVSRSFCGLVKPVSRVLSPPFSVTVGKNDFHEKKIDPRKEKALKTTDNISEKYTLIYRAPLMNYMRAGYYMGVLSGLSFPLILWNTPVLWGDVEFPTYMCGIALMNSMFEFYAFSVGMLTTTALLISLPLKYPVRIYTDERRSNYIAVYLNTPWNYRNVYFQKSEITRSKSIMPWRELMFNFGRRSAILMDDHFISPVEFNRMFNDCINEK